MRKFKLTLKAGYLISGQTILEIILSVTLVGLIFTGLFFLFNRVLIFESESKNDQTALEMAQTALEELKLQAAVDFSTLQSATETKDGFLIEKLVQEIDPDTKKVKVKVSWQEFNRTREFELTSLLTNWRNVQTGLGGSSGGSGGTGPSGDWQHPRTLASIDLGPGNEGTDVLVKGKTVFLTSIASDKKKSDFHIVDVSDPENPFFKAQINVGVGANSLALSEQYAYLAQNNSNNQLQIISIANENNPYLVNQVSLVNNDEEALSIFYDDSYVFIGSQEEDSGPELQIFDVSNPNNPTFISSLEIGGDVNDIFVRNNILYLATSKSNTELILIDLQDIRNPRVIANKSLSEKALSVYPYSDDLIFVGTVSKLIILNKNDLSLVSTVNTDGAVNDLYAKNYLAFLATSNSNKELQIINISDPQNPYLYSFFNFPQMATGIDYLNNLLYISVRSNDALRIVTSQ